MPASYMSSLSKPATLRRLQSTYLESSVGGCLYGSKKVVIDRARSHSESTVDNSAIDMNSEVHFQDIVILKYDILGSGVGSPMSTNVVETKSSREAHASFESISGLKTLVTSQCSDAFFDLIGELAHRDTWFGDGLHVLTDLTMYLSGFAIVTQEVSIHVPDGILMAQFCGRGTLEIVIVDCVLDDFALRILVVRKDIGKCDPGWGCLLPTSGLLFLLVILSLFLVLAYVNLELSMSQIGYRLAYCFRSSCHIGCCHLPHPRRLRLALRAHQKQVL